jgi:hypothetical protein
VLVLLALAGGFAFYQKNIEASQQAALVVQQTTFAAQNFQLAVLSAQTVLNQLSTSIDRGDITIKGANGMLKAAEEIVAHAHNVENTKQTIDLLIVLGFTASDIYAALGDNTQAYKSAKDTKELAERLLAANLSDPEVQHRIYGSIWRMGDAVSSRGGDEATQKKALAEYVEADKLARRLVELVPENVTYQHDLMKRSVTSMRR